MRYLKYWLGGMLTAALVACGGGGGNPGTSSGSSGGGSTTSNVASIELSASAINLNSADSTGITVTAVLKDKNNNALASQTPGFAASSGVLGSVSGASDSAGRSTATLTAGTDRSNRTITVTVTAGSVVKTLTIPVVGTTLTVAGSGSILIGSSSQYTVSLKDTAGVGVSGISISVLSALGNGLSATAVTTDAAGSASFTYTATRAGADTLTVAGQGTSAQYAVSVNAQDFAFSAPATGTSIAVNSATSVQVRYLSSGAGVAGQVVNFSSTRGAVSPASAVTDASGVAFASVTSSTAGPATLTAELASSGAQTTQAVNFVATTPATIALQINPSAVTPNTAGSPTAKSVTLTAVVRDAYGNAVKGRTVNFSILADTSGGSIANGTVVSDSNGTVSTLFYPGTAATAANGVQIQATVVGTSLSSTATLSVNNQAAFLSFGFATVVTESADKTTNSLAISVRVVDATAAPIANQTVNLSLYPPEYAKGHLAWNGASWAIDSTSFASCLNEDVNRNGILDSGEDTDHSGTLTPGLPALVNPATVTTDAAGNASFVVTYGKQYSLWTYFGITARTTVSGTESSRLELFVLPGAASDYTTQTLTPPGRISPFGNTPDCTVAN